MLALCQAAWYYPITGVIALPAVFLLKVTHPCSEQSFKGKSLQGKKLAHWLHGHTGSPMWLARCYTVMLSWVVAWCPCHGAARVLGVTGVQVAACSSQLWPRGDMDLARGVRVRVVGSQ